MREFGQCCPQMTFRANLGVKEIDLVVFVHLLQEDEGENCVWPETSVIRSKTLPQTEESFLPHDRRQYILQKENENDREGGCVKDMEKEQKGWSLRSVTLLHCSELHCKVSRDRPTIQSWDTWLYTRV